MKQSAVEWLIEQMSQSTTMKGWIEIFDKAKEMEKQQIVDAYKYSVNGNILAEQYYNETFKNK